MVIVGAGELINASGLKGNCRYPLPPAEIDHFTITLQATPDE
jgi:hypothetical protein